MLNVVCVKWGDAYGPEYVNYLYDMVARNMPEEPGDWQFLCATEDKTGLDEGIKVLDLPPGLKGWWNKLFLFKKGFLPEGRVLFFDLDTVIVGDLAPFVEYTGRFAILRDFYRPNGYGSGLMAWESGFGADIWDDYEKEGRPVLEGGDQIWIERHPSTCGADRFQDIFPEQVASYKEDCTDDIPPLRASVVCFHGQPKPHNCGSSWVEMVWKRGGAEQAKLRLHANTDWETVRGNAVVNCARDLPWINLVPAHSGAIAIVGGGPSLRETWKTVRSLQRIGVKVACLNGTAEYLRTKFVVPDFYVMLDSRKDNLAFVQHPNSATKYLIASQVDPSVFDALAGQDVTVWHSSRLDQDPSIFDPYLKTKPIGTIGGGSTVGIRSIGLFFALGYRDFHLFGMDCCHKEDAHHAYAQPWNDGARVLDLWAAGRQFKAAPWMVRQAEDFQRVARTLLPEGVVFHSYGDGVITHLVKTFSGE